MTWLKQPFTDMDSRGKRPLAWRWLLKCLVWYILNRNIVLDFFGFVCRRKAWIGPKLCGCFFWKNIASLLQYCLLTIYISNIFQTFLELSRLSSSMPYGMGKQTKLCQYVSIEYFFYRTITEIDRRKNRELKLCVSGAFQLWTERVEIKIKTNLTCDTSAPILEDMGAINKLERLYKWFI